MELGVATVVGLMLLVYAVLSNRQFESYQREVQEKFNAFEAYVLKLEKELHELKFDVDHLSRN